MTTTVADVIAGVPGAIRYSPRFERRSRDNVFKQDITKGINGCTIDLDNDRVTMRIARFVVDGGEIEFNSWSFRDDFVAVFVDFQMPDESIQSFPLGFYQFSKPTRQLSDKPQTWSVSASDLTDQVNQAEFDDTYTVAAGTNVIVATRAILDLLGLRHNMPGGFGNVSNAFVYPLKTSYLAAINEILRCQNLFNTYPNEIGEFSATLRLRPDQYVYDANGAVYTINLANRIAVTYDIDNEPRMILLPGGQFTPEATNQLPNKAVLAINDPNNPAIAGTTFLDNNDPQSPISQVSKGANTVLREGVDRVAQVVLWGLYELAEADTRAETLSFTTFLDPRRTAHEYYRLSNIPGIDTNIVGWRVMNWQMDLFTGIMAHKVGAVRRINLNIAAIL